jgi:tetratricopeptide (TPR) repeat protein
MTIPPTRLLLLYRSSRSITAAYQCKPGSASESAESWNAWYKTQAITDLEAELARHPDQPGLRDRLAQYCNNRAWELATAPKPQRDVAHALELSQKAVDLAPGQSSFLNTLGVAQYRAGLHAEAVTTLERSLAAGRGQTDAFDLFFLAMAHHRLGHADQARARFEQSVRWWRERKNLPAQYVRELTGFRAEAEVVLGLAASSGELPANVFAPE